MKDRLLVLSRYSRLGASSRLRTLQYRQWLEDAGFDVEYAPFFDDKYLQRLYLGCILDNNHELKAYPLGSGLPTSCE